MPEPLLDYQTKASSTRETCSQPAAKRFDRSRRAANFILFLGRDAGLLDRFADYLTAERLPFKRFETIESVIANLASEPDAILVIDIGGFGKRQSVVRLIEYLSARAGGAVLTFICVAAVDSIEHRLAATRAGAAAFFPDSVSPEDFIAKLTELNVDATETPSRILIVDDSPMGATTTTEILNRSGFETRRSDSPLDLIDVAQAFHPDLVLMDTELADDPLAKPSGCRECKSDRSQ